MKNKKILVTGGLGFIGSHFVELLHKKCTNCIITIVDNYSYCVSQKTEDYLWDLYEPFPWYRGDKKNKLEIIYSDINDYDDVAKHDYIINFAAESHVDNSIKNGDPFLTSNVNGVYYLLKQVKEHQRFIQIGTDEVYGSLELNSSPSEEGHLLEPSSVYSSTKAAADLISLSFYHTYNKDVIVTRCTNNFGPRQYHEKLIPVVIKKALADESIPVYGTGENIRQWIYVKDHCEKIYNILKFGTAGKIYNIAPDYYEGESEINNINLVQEILFNLKKPEKLISFVEDRKGHDVRYSLRQGMYRAMMIMNDQQLELPGIEKTFADDLRYTIMWYKKHNDWWDKKSNN
tara:strand:- start:2141 stop:3175 length:1035 start_codon:yes stop_codon:yes gene_type:complete